MKRCRRPDRGDTARLVFAVVLALGLVGSGCSEGSVSADQGSCTVLASVVTPQNGRTLLERVSQATPSGESTETVRCSHVPGVCCVAIQPLGEVSEEEIEAVRSALVDQYGVEIRVLEPVELPEEAWYPPRRRWRAERLLDFLAPRLPPGCDRVLGLTAEDISTTKGEHEDWGILGLADISGSAAVISSFRCRRRVRDVPPLERLGRVAIHELGHSLGLLHCSTTGCYLEDAGGTVLTVDRETFLCEVCRRRLGWIP